MKLDIVLFLVVIGFYNVSQGAYLKNVPITIKQPSGNVVKIFASGDEFYNWAHDKDNYTIVQNTKTGYYCYAVLEDDELQASKYIVGKDDPAKANLESGINISSDKIIAKREEFFKYIPRQTQTISKSNKLLKSPQISQTFNNLVIYIRFADQSEFLADQATYTSMFNSISSGVNSVRNYFNEVSYDQLDVSSTFYPSNNGTSIISCQDNHIRDYYLEYSSSNDSGYVSSEKYSRESLLISKAINSVKDQIPTSLNLDYNNDGYVDNICFIIRGIGGGFSELLWPHQSSIYSESINGISTKSYNIQTENFLTSKSVSVICHEMFHSLGAPDLYHYNMDANTPVGAWDIMACASNPPPHMGAYMKFAYGGWLNSIPEITESGAYTLNSLSSSNNNCYKVAIKNSSEYFVLEYRNKSGSFENSIPASGLIVYRINESFKGNGRGSGPGGVNDEVYIYRLHGSLTSNGWYAFAFLSEESDRGSFTNETNPFGFTSDGNYADIYIKNISTAGNTIRFDVRFCDGEDLIYSNTNNLPDYCNASNSISTSGTVIVLNSNNVVFEASNEVLLNDGFEVQQGGVFEINMNGCGEQ